MQSEELRDLIMSVVTDMKGKDARVLDVRHMTDVTDFMVVVSGTSDRHVSAIADHINEVLRESGVRAIGTEGEEHGDWVLLDFGDVVVHVMRPETRVFYDLESLWGEEAAAIVSRRREQTTE